MGHLHIQAMDCDTQRDEKKAGREKTVFLGRTGSDLTVPGEQSLCVCWTVGPSLWDKSQ